MKGVYTVVGNCTECDIPMMSTSAWRAGVQPDGHAVHAGHGLCRKHYWRWQSGSIETKTLRSRDEVLEDYLMIRDDVANIRQAADRMGMTFAALDRALYRARLDGDDRAMPPSTQALRAASRGAPYRIAA